MSSKKPSVAAASPETFCAALDAIVLDGPTRERIDADPEAALDSLGFEGSGLPTRTGVRAGLKTFAPPYVPVGPIA